jgi:glycosyltransferase involved in cell wall biosynthesis
MRPRASVIVTRCNLPRLLDLVLHGYAHQSCLDFELVIAEDDSPAGRSIVQHHVQEAPFRIRLVDCSQEGFRRAEALNRAILESRGSHLILSDGDALPSRTFVEEYLEVARPNTCFLGSHSRFGPELTASLTPASVRAGEFERQGRGIERLEGWRILVPGSTRRRHQLESQGLNLLVDRASLFRVNGFDHAFAETAGEHLDLQTRMRLTGVRVRRLRNRARLYHLHHPSYEAPLVRREGRGERPDRKAEASDGLRELAARESVGRSQPPGPFGITPDRGPFRVP